MNLGQLLAALTFSAAKKLLTDSSLSWNSVNNWIATNSNLDNYGRGYAGGQLLDSRTAAFAELRKEPLGANGFRVSAAIFLDSRNKAIATQTWEAKKLDSALEKTFGRNLRVRIDV